MSSSSTVSASREMEAKEISDRKSSVSSEESRASSESSSSSGSSERNQRDELEIERATLELERHVSPGLVIAGSSELGKVVTSRSTATNMTTDPEFEVDYEDDGSDDPRQWSLAYKGMIIASVSFSTLIVVMYSTSYASGIPGMMESFGISNETIVVLGITTYLVGLAVGSLVLAPLSEMYGRRPTYLGALALFVVFFIPCALAKNLETILISRFIGALFGAAMISNAPGTLGDIISEDYRALAFSFWSLGPMNGPIIGPLVGGFVFQNLDWRWTNWVAMMGATVAFCLMSLVKETYAPAILRKKAERRRKETDDERWWSRYDERKKLVDLLKLNLSRPFIMIVTEPICIFWDIYIAVVYAMMYLCFVAYPIVFSEQRGWSPGITGLSYAGMGLGGVITIVSEPLIRRWINSYRPDRSQPAGPGNSPPPEAMVAVVCVAAILTPAGELLFAWTSPPWIPWIFPILSGIPFGMGNCACFIYAGNYLLHSYGIYAASALAGNAVFRSIIGGLLPLAGPSMYAAMGSRWAGTLLAGLEIICIPIPFVFFRYGHKIRMKSSLIRKMREDQERLEAKKRRNEELAKARAERAVNGRPPVPRILEPEKEMLAKEMEV